MTLVNIDAQHFTNGPREQGVGTVMCEPYSSLIDGGAFVTSKPISLTYNRAPVVVELAELPTGNAWRININVDNETTWLLVAPTGAGPVDLTSLPNLDPDTMDPLPDATPAWVAPIAAAPGLIAAKTARALRRFHVSLSTAGTTPCDIAFLCGDSISKGFTASSVNKRFVSVFRDGLRARFQPAGVPGGLGFFDGANQAAFSDYPITSVNPVVDQTFGLGLDALRMTAAPQTITASGVVTSIDVMFKGSADGSTGYLFWDNDGANAPQSFNTGNLANNKGGRLKRLIGPVTAAQHSSVLYGGIVPGDVLVEGHYLYNGDETKGIRVWEAGLSGRQLHDYVNTTSWLDSLATVQPSLVVLPFGSNDYSTGRTSAQVKADALATIASIRATCTVDPSIVLMPYYDRAATGQAEPWSSFVAAANAIADADDDICVYDLGPLFGPWTGDDRGGLVNASDKVHPTDAGHASIGRGLARFVSP